MHVVQVDERDVRWEEGSPRFRVFFFDQPDPTGSASEFAFDLTDADILDALRWAESNAKGRLTALALVNDADSRGSNRRGLIWLLGGDPNDPALEDSERIARMRRRLQVPDGDDVDTPR